MSISQMLWYNDLSTRLKHILNVAGVRGTSDMSVDGLAIRYLIKRDKFGTYEIDSILVSVSP